ncbi:molecular chaperone [Alcaligenaceae bacterium]|nr:molecular chaperone [Alcaligenaceae bacterium]
MLKSTGTHVRPAGRALAFLLGIGTVPASAVTLQISPVTVEMAQGQSGTIFTLSNPGQTPIHGQLRVFNWDQINGEDVLSPAEHIIVSPPMTQIAAGQSQLVRLVRTGQDNRHKEASYRVLIDEIIDLHTQPPNGVMVRMRYSVPIFLDNGLTPGDRSNLHWALLCGPKHWQLRIENKGNRRARISNVALEDGKGRKYVIQKGLLGYALSGRYRTWDLDIPVNTVFGAQAIVKTTINAKESINKAYVQCPAAPAPRKAR